MLDGNWSPAARLEVVEFEGVGELVGRLQCPRHVLLRPTVLEDNLVDEGWKGF